MSSANQTDLSSALLAISQSLADRSQLAQTLDAVLTAARQMTFAKHGVIYVLDQTGQNLIPTIVHCKDNPLVSHPWSALALESASETDPFTYALQNGEVVLINTLYQYNGYDCETIYQVERTLGIQSNNLLAWPLMAEQRTIGLLVLFDLSVIDNENALTAFCEIAGNSIRQSVWLEEYDQMIQNLQADNAALTRENAQLKQRKQDDYQGPIAESELMLDVFRRLDKVLTLPVDVLIRGETGTGKEVIAKYIHDHSNRANQPLIVQNCAAIPEQLLESELFGHRKGAFTGADQDKVGLFEAADGGTLFLDEIGDMPLLLQAKLLRVLQERRVRPVGASQEIEINVRVIAATHCHLMEKIKAGEFRADLFYRLNVFPIMLPPLRERQADILPLAEYFCQQSAKSLQLAQHPGLSAHVRQQLLDYPYPGNVRELKNIIERAVLLSDFETITQIELGDDTLLSIPGTHHHQDQEPNASAAPLPEEEMSASEAIVTDIIVEEICDEEMTPDGTNEAQDESLSSPIILDGESYADILTDDSKGLKDVVSLYERHVILDCLKSHNWQSKRVAEILSVPVSTLHHKMKKYNIFSAPSE